MRVNARSSGPNSAQDANSKKSATCVEIPFTFAETMKQFAWLLSVFAFSCLGPDAPDAAICRDAIARVCTPPLCSSVATTLQVSSACEATLLTRTQCDRDTFSFQSPSREVFLQCRSLLLREGSSTGSAVSCVDIQNAFSSCPALPRFLGAP